MPAKIRNKLKSVSTLRTAQVPESLFGVWFLGTKTWETHVLKVAIKDLDNLISDRQKSYGTIIDIGCGWGQSFKFLSDRFSPQKLIGADIDPNMLRRSAKEAARLGIDVELYQGSSAHVPLGDEAVDIVFCHQTFHHFVDQENAVREFHRILKPGGLLLFAESTRAYIHSWMIRLLFRHPMEVQKSAEEYLEMIKAAGFQIEPSSISYPYLWWSRKDLGIGERWFGIRPPGNREETLLNFVGIRD